MRSGRLSNFSSSSKTLIRTQAANLQSDFFNDQKKADSRFLLCFQTTANPYKDSVVIQIIHQLNSTSHQCEPHASVYSLKPHRRGGRRLLPKIPYKIQHGDQVFECVCSTARDAICLFLITYDYSIDRLMVLDGTNEWIEISRESVDRLMQSIRKGVQS